MAASTSRLRKLGVWICLVVLPFGCAESTRTPSPAETAGTKPVEPIDLKAISRIREEGLQHSQVMQTLAYLSDVIGPRLTGSPNQRRANEWTRDKLTSWGLSNAAIEPWGEFGRGWAVKRFSIEVLSPQPIPLIAWPKAWSPGFDQPIETEVVYFNPKSTAEMESYAGKLAGKIVLLGDVRQPGLHLTPDATRYTTEELQRLAAGRNGRGRGPASQPSQLLQSNRGPTTTGRAGLNPAGAQNLAVQVFDFAAKENAALICTSSSGDDGTIFVQSAFPTGRGRGGRGPTTSVWLANANPTPPQVAMAPEDFNRLTRILGAGETVRMACNLQVEFKDDDTKAYNTVAEIPGSDLKDQIVMLGGHLDSWHSGTGATDNGAGVSAAMEAVRIIKTLGLQPRRTIRIALWTGEEEGIFGSAGYVKQHFGSAARGGRGRSDSQPVIRIEKGPEYDKLSAYFNLDNGGGSIRGIYTQGNPFIGPIFQSWLAPFADLGATTVTTDNTGGTDHLSFDAVGLPGFQFIQDWLDYNTRTHHSNMDVFDRIQEEDMKQASTILAAFVYNAAMTNEMMPRKTGYTTTNP